MDSSKSKSDNPILDYMSGLISLNELAESMHYDDTDPVDKLAKDSDIAGEVDMFDILAD